MILSRRGCTDDSCIKPTIRLPAKKLPLRRAYLDVVAVAIITIASLFGFYFILRSIHRWLPDRDPSLDITEALSTACDLITSKSTFIENIFTIDLRVPQQFSFGMAKGVDVLWDFLVGQGGRLLLAWISYKVFMDGLARLMETSLISYQLYANMVFETTSLQTTWHCARAISTGHGWRGRAFLAWFTVATIYVLGFSTLMSAATGYVGSSTASYRMPDNDFVTGGSKSILSCYKITLQDPHGFQLSTKLVKGPSIFDFRGGPSDGEYATIYNSQWNLMLPILEIC